MNRLKSRHRSVGLLTLSLGLSLFAMAGPAFAHVGYVTLPNGISNLNSTVASNAGWVAGQNPTTWGNSHDNRFFTFNLADTMQVDFTIAGTNTNGNGLLNPGYSIFAGTVPSGSHDGAGALPGGAMVPTSYVGSLTGFASWSPFAGTNDEIDANNGAAGLTTAHWGRYRSNADVTMANNGNVAANIPGTVSTMTYTGLSGSNGTGSSITGSYLLGPGIYSLVVGGANPFDLQTYLNAAIATGGNYCTSVSATCTAEQVAAGSVNAAAYNVLRLARTFNIQFSAVPIPAAVYLFGSGLVGMAALARRRIAA
jgi:hypothetical protein